MVVELELDLILVLVNFFENVIWLEVDGVIVVDFVGNGMLFLVDMLLFCFDGESLCYVLKIGGMSEVYFIS